MYVVLYGVQTSLQLTVDSELKRQVIVFSSLDVASNLTTETGKVVFDFTKVFHYPLPNPVSGSVCISSMSVHGPVSNKWQYRN